MRLLTLFILSVLLLATASVRAATFTVNLTGDAADSSLADGVCDSDSSLAGSQCTLRAAIQNANVAAGADTIRFNIPTTDPNFAGGVFTIKPASALPTLAPGSSNEGDGTIIDGATQAAFTGNTNAAGPEIVLNGAAAGLTNGLRISAAQCVVKSLVINGFGVSGVSIGSATALSNRVEGCYLGTNAAGNAAEANGFEGVDIFTGAQKNVIGGTTTTTRNLISGNLGDGVSLSGTGVKGNVVRGNTIGLNAARTTALPNQTNGVHLSNGAESNVIGGTVSGTANVISGNVANGMMCEGTATQNNRVEGNFIGTNPAGTAALANTGFGVFIQNGAHNNTIGGTDASDGSTDGMVKARNIISGNRFYGILISGAGSDANLVRGNHIGVNTAGTAAVPNGNSGVAVSAANNTLIGSTAAGAGNVISGNIGPGVSIGSAIGTKVQGNFIGTNATGSAAVPNSNGGVSLTNGANSSTIGGTATVARNIISGNGSSGVAMQGANTTKNNVQGNFIGTNAAGTAALGNQSGVTLFQAANGNTIGGTITGARNIISGNRGVGLLLTENGTDKNLVQGNYIGTNAAGSGALPNGADGVEISNQAASNTIGGTATAARNVISANTFAGVFITDSSTSSNVVQGNFIGTDATGSAARANGFSGVEISGGASFNTVGGTITAARNVISGNGENGIVFSGSGTTGNALQGNFIGTDATGASAIGNNLFGVDIFRGVVQNSVGGAASGMGNRIAFNRSGGVRVRDTSFAIEIRRNAIFSNGGLGINLQPSGEAANTPTSNDVSDSDSGPNALQNYPVITTATVSSGVTTVKGTLNSTSSSSFAIELFRSTAAVGPDPSGFGEGEVYMGAKNVTTNASGNVNFTFSLSGDFTNQFFTATATDTVSTLSSSEFSRAVQAVVAPAANSGNAVESSEPSLLSAEANASANSVTLTFDSALDENSVADPTHYAVTVGAPSGSRYSVAASDAPYDAKTNTVTLLLPEGTLKPGDLIIVTWQGGSAKLTAE